MMSNVTIYILLSLLYVYYRGYLATCNGEYSKAPAMFSQASTTHIPSTFVSI